MAGLTMSMSWERRPAIYRPNKYRVHELGIPEGSELLVDVLGIFQCKDEDNTDAYFVIEYPDGKCGYAAVHEIQFTDKEVPYADHSH